MDDFLQHKQHQFCKSRQNSPKEKKHQFVRMAAFMDVLLNTKDDNAEMIWCLFTLNEGLLCFA